jgi:tRNA-dihydrouridine synthase
MISAAGLNGGGPFEHYYTEAGPEPEKMVWQLLGSCKGEMDDYVRPLVEAAERVDALPGIGVDINMGCSAPAITRAGGGARWLSFPDRAARMVEAVRKVVHKQLSVKLRIEPEKGVEKNTTSSFLLQFARLLQDAGADMVVVHGRTADEKFKHLARWEPVYALKQALNIKVGGNGDIDNAETLLKRANFAAKPGDKPLDAVMVGRGAVRKPWIFAEARCKEAGLPFSAPNIEETGLLFLDLLAKYQPPEFYLSRAHRFFAYFCDNLKFGNYTKTLLARETTLDGMARVWKTACHNDN